MATFGFLGPETVYFTKPRNANRPGESTRDHVSRPWSSIGSGGASEPI
jgi:hypothetical protein